MIPTLKITLLGPLDIKLGDTRLSVVSDKAKALLVYLLCTRHAQTRLHLAGLLWDERSENQARSNLRTVLAELRRHLAPDTLLVERKTLAFNPTYPHQVDVFDLEQALNKLIQQQAPTGSLPVEAVNQATKALDLYQGQFLAHFFLNHAPQFADWQRSEQNRLEKLLQTALERLIQHAFATETYQPGEGYARRLLRLEPSYEKAHRYLMILLAKQGRRDEALRQYKSCCEQLAKDLAVEPSAETTALYEQIRTGRVPLPTTTPKLETEPAVVPPLPCPYRGLAAFRPDDSHLFFGRATFTQNLLRAIESRCLVTVSGASGSGKSSVVFAGLVPTLLNRRHEKWLYAAFCPDQDPFWGAATALTPLLEADLSQIQQITAASNLADHLRQRQTSLVECLLTIQQIYPDHRLLLIVDQFEELFTLVHSIEVRQHFLEALFALVQTVQGPSPRLVLTLRADFLGQALSASHPLANTLQTALELLGPMTRDELRAVIEQPAALHNVSFETKLIDRLLDDVGQEEGNLPLLEFTLTELWQHQRQGTLTHLAYEEIGQLKGALGCYADSIYQRLPPDKQEQARRLFVQLVNPGVDTEDTCRRAPRTELAAAWSLVSELAAKRLVVTNQGTTAHAPETVEIIHETLIHHWARLQQWVDEVRSFRVWQERLRFALAQWQADGQNVELLLRSAPLATAEYWLAEHGKELGQIECDFIQASATWQEREQIRQNKERYFRWGALALSIILFGLLFWIGGPLAKAWWVTQCLPQCPNKNFAGLDLTGANLHRANLHGSDLRNAILRRADLSEADLSEADLNQTNLTGAALWGADLRGADLSGAILSGADLNWANLLESKITDMTKIDAKWRLVWEIATQGAEGRDLHALDLRNVDLHEANLKGADLHNADLGEAHLWGADLSRANLSGTNLNGADLSWTDLNFAKIDNTTQIDAKWRLVWEIVNHRRAGRALHGVDLSKADLHKAQLEDANLFRADLRVAELWGAILINADLREADLSETNLQWSVLAFSQLNGAKLHGANLSGTNLTKVDLTDAVYDDATIWPSGFDPQTAGARSSE